MLSKDKIGDVVEFKAVAWLISQGCEVFKNVCSKGPVDLIALLPDGSLKKIDVKKAVCKSRRTVKVYEQRLRQNQLKLDIELLYYNEVTDSFHWSIEDVYCSLGRDKQTKETQIVKVGEKRGTLSQICKSLGVNVRTVRMMMRRDTNLTVEQAIQRAGERCKQITFGGIVYRDRSHLCSSLGLSRESLEYWNKEKCLPLEQAIEETIRRKQMKIERDKRYANQSD